MKEKEKIDQAESASEKAPEKEKEKEKPSAEADGAEKPKRKEKEKEKEKEKSETETLRAELAAQKDLLLRTAAEFDNYKKRTERERLSTAEYAKASVIKTLLPVFDNAERASAADKDSAEYAKGVEMIVRQLGDIVKNLGITEIGAKGENFDPTIHEAVMHVEDPDAGENVIVEVLQRGYKIGDTVICAAMVKVAN